MDPATKNRFALFAIFVTALLTPNASCVVTNYAMKGQMRLELDKRQYATTNDLVTFLRQQDILSTNWLKQQDVQYTNWLREQSVVFTNWVKQQVVLNAKRDAETKLEQEKWQAQQESLFQLKLDEIKQTQAGGQTYWEKQQQLLYLSARNERQEQKISLILEQYYELQTLWSKAEKSFQYFLALCNGRLKGQAIWPSSRYFGLKENAKELNTLEEDFAKQKFKLDQTLTTAQFVFSSPTWKAASNALISLEKERMLMVDGDPSWQEAVEAIQSEKIPDKDKVFKVTNEFRRRENERFKSPLFLAMRDLLAAMTQEQVTHRVFAVGLEAGISTLTPFPPTKDLTNSIVTLTNNLLKTTK